MIAESTAFNANPFTLELRTGLSAREVDRRIGLSFRVGDVGARGTSFYLVDLAESGGYQEFGFHSLVLYAEARFHMQPSTTRS